LKYIFVIGAPGSKWSSVAKNIYYSPDIDRSDYHEDRTYQDSLHIGSYFDPGMEFGKFFNHISRYSKQECETEFDRPFDSAGSGIRIIKSHVLANHVDFLKETWPDCAIVLVSRSTDACLGWWVRCGGFDITYPDYREYYQNLQHMGKLIEQQNAAIADAVIKYTPDISSPANNSELCAAISIQLPPEQYRQFYKSNDIVVKVIHPNT